MYKEAADQIAKNIKITNGKMEVLLQDWDNLSDDDKSVFVSKIYQKNFQKQLQSQINDVLKDLNSGQFKSIDEYLKKCYETGFIGAMYDIAGQGIPIISPIDQKRVITALRTNSKIKGSLYQALGEDVDSLKKRIASSISRGIATADSYENIARNIVGDSNVGFNRAMRIARTEGHRIHSNSAFDAQLAARDAGADIVKQWDSTMDGKTRTTHRLLDGQIRELEEPFEMGGMKAMYPSDFGRPEEDINCRCVLLQRARWALDDDELAVLREKAKYHGTLVDDSKEFGHQKAKGFADFKRKYINAADDIDNRDYKTLTLDEFKKMKHKITKDERSIVYGRGHFSGYINSSNARKINSMIRNGEKLPSDYQKIADTLQNIIDKNVLDNDIMVTRYVTDDTLESIVGVKFPQYKMSMGKDVIWDLIADVPKQIKNGQIYTELGFLSTSGVPEANVMTSKGVKLEIKVRKGTQCYVTTNNKESEIIFGRNTKLKITGSRIENNRTAQRKVVLECVIV